MLQHSEIKKGNEKVRKRTFRFSISVTVTRHTQRIQTLSIVAYVRCKARD